MVAPGDQVPVEGMSKSTRWFNLPLADFLLVVPAVQINDGCIQNGILGVTVRNSKPLTAKSGIYSRIRLCSRSSFLSGSCGVLNGLC